MTFRFRQPVSDDAATLLDWRTRPQITRFMFTDLAAPDVARQRAWLRAMEQRRDFVHFVIEAEDRPIGYVAFTDIDALNRRTSVGLYVADEADQRRFAGLLAPFIGDYAFYVLNVNKIINTVMAGNERVVKFQKLQGYREIGVLRQHVLKYGRWHDVYLLELLREVYVSRPRPFSLEDTLSAFDQGIV